MAKKLKNSKRKENSGYCLRQGQRSKPLFVNLNEFKKIWKNIEEATIVKLKGGSSDEVLVYDTEKDPVRGIYSC